MNDLTTKQKNIISLVNSNSLRKDAKGYYYAVQTSIRRSGKMRVSEKEITTLKKAGLITTK